MSLSRIQQLEQYTIHHPQEVLLITLETAEEQDQILIYKGFSSSLMRPTDFNPDIPLVSDEAKIISIDRLSSPYNPSRPHYLQQGLTWEEMQHLLEQIKHY